ncbi:DUF397 domain-containing protein [Nocardia macrotermitis]|uniref:DUF397 domain-containing protein n=1 Tax=Nocardia macrotermitis TaxID=2585198 RepID=A0A7K0D878_9NOCA|nr:DUF397 domain-containing protein [Nocardia macrotermitis]MQY21789.1 hypothetical protein [Nocardia macrotermitis]
MNDDLSTTKWFKSTHSETSANCVEVAWLEQGRVGIRDSKTPTGPALTFAPADWDAFIASTQDGDLNHS